MNQDDLSTMGTTLLTFLAGAAVGAVVVALTTPKSGPELRRDLKGVALRTKCKADDMVDGARKALVDMKERTVLASSDLQRGISKAAKDLMG